jgi:RNA polymerase sigma-70 factor (ECF subfamily)
MLGTAFRQQTDSQLLAAIASGQERALREFHRRHARAAWRFAWRILGDAADAEDAVAEAFIDLWQCAARFAHQSQPRTWFFAIVRNKALQMLRRRDDTTSLDDTQAPPELAAEAPEQEWAMPAHTTAEELERLFMRLPPEQREAFYLTVVEELSVAEIANIQGVPTGTVATRVHHARRKMRAWLQGS